MKFPNRIFAIVQEAEEHENDWREHYDSVEEAADSGGDTNRVAEYQLVSMGKITTTRKFVAAK